MVLSLKVTSLIIPILRKRKALILLVEIQVNILHNEGREQKITKKRIIPPKDNLAEGDEIIAAVISQVNIVAHIKGWE